MNRAALRLGPWLLLTASIALKVVTVALVMGMQPAARSADGLGFLAWAPGVLAFGVVGALVAARRPNNAVGWLFLAIGVTEPFAVFADAYAHLASADGDIARAAWIGVLGAAANSTFTGFLLLIILLFPTGNAPSRRWRPVVGVVLAWQAIVTTAILFAPGPIAGTLPMVSPLAASGIGGEIAAGLAGLTEVGAVPLILLTVPALLTRWRGADGVERAQLKWFASSIALLAFIVVAIVPVWELVEDLPPAVDGLFTALTIGSVAAIPMSAGIAILRYRLYDIDVVIRRTLVYGAVVGVLAVVYASLVLVLQAPLSAVTGGGTLPVALSTLAIAALFGPLRARVRAVVDRRFYRSRYDAQRTAEAVAGRLRDQVELEAVGGLLADASNRAVQPAFAAVWLRPRGAR